MINKEKYKGLSHSKQVDLYCEDVLSGEIPACQYVKDACKRHLEDLELSETDESYPYYYDRREVDKFCAFSELMVAVEGKWAGKPITLEPWQKFAFGSKFGWKKKVDGFRRFRETYVEIPRKSGKSTIAAIEALYMLTIDGEAGAQEFCGASNKEQAMVVFRIAKLMVDNNPRFANKFGLKTMKESIFCDRTSSFFKPMIGKPKDGANPSYTILDELHEAPSSEMYDTIKTGMGARQQPLMSVITTAGFNLQGVCYKRREEAIKTLQKVITDDRLFTVIYTIDADDKWEDFGNWRKANPNLGVSVFEDYLLSQYETAMRDATQQNAILTKNLNVWCNASTAWINMPRWRECEVKELRLEDFRGENCWIGIDLASKVDLVGVSFVFHRDDYYYLFSKAYINKERAMRPENEHYRRYNAMGYLDITEGASTDFQYVMAQLFGSKARAKLRDREEWRYYFGDVSICGETGWEDMFRIKEIAYDPRESELMMQTIQTFSSVPCVEFAQSPAFISEPAKTLEAMYLDKKLLHGFNPVLDWNFSNAVLKQSLAKAYYPTKERAEAKIDLVMSSIMALSRALQAKTSTPSIFFI